MKPRLLRALLLLLHAGPALASDPGGLFSAVTATSDYQGVSSTQGQPALQGHVHWWRPDGWYAGAFGSQVDYKGATGASYEVDGYAGRNVDLDQGRTRLTGELMYSAFPDNRTPGPTFDFLQLKAKAQRSDGPWTAKATAAFSPQASYGAGQAWLAEIEAERKLRAGVTAKARVGRRWVGRGVDRSFWSLGAAWTRAPLTVELRYEDTDLSRHECGFDPDICGAAVVAAVTAALPPLMLGKR